MRTSATRTSSICSLTPESTSGRASLANPGSTPFTKIDTPPASAASTVGVIIPSSTTPYGYCRNTGPEDSTLMPARSMPCMSPSASNRRSSAMAEWMMASGFSA